MAARKCPQCLTVVPAAQAAAFTDAIECPGCKSRLEVSQLSRHLATWAGLLAGLVMWRLSARWVAEGDGAFAWVIPVLLAFLAYSVVAAVGTMFVADLRMRPPEPVGEPLHGGHAGGTGSAANAHAHH